MAVERTLSIVKPDGVAKNLIGEVYRRFEIVHDWMQEVVASVEEVIASADIDAILIAPDQLATLQATEPVVVIDTRDADTFYMGLMLDWPLPVNDNPNAVAMVIRGYRRVSYF